MAVDEVVIARLRDMRNAMKLSINANASSFTTEELLSVSTMFDEWAVGSNYKTGKVIRYNGGLYKVLQDVTGSQAEHTPDVASSLYKRISEPGPDGIFSWVQPLGATDAYSIGSKVTHNGKTWQSSVDNNVWEPGVYGWTEVTKQ